MSPETLMLMQKIAEVFQVTVLLCILWGIIRNLMSGQRSMRMIFFGMAIACAFLTDTYWLIFDTLYPNKVLPFAANEFGEWALFLLIGKLLVTDLSGRRISLWKEITAMVAFITVNAAMWIYWSGEWVQDIVTGFTLGYLLCCLAIRMKYSEEFSGKEEVLIALACAVAVLTQGISIFAPDPVNTWFEVGCYIFLAVIILLLIVCTVREIFFREGTERAVCFAFFGFAWCLLSMYMSTGLFYLAFFACATVSLLLMFFAMRKEVERT